MKTAAPGRGEVALIGIKSDANSSFLRGSAAAPEFIRQALYSPASNLFSELGVELAGEAGFVDAGDRDIADGPQEFMTIETIILELAGQGALPLVLGGDHAVSYPVLRALHGLGGPINVLHFDAHADLYDDFEGNPHSHASPFARVMEEGLARRLVQVGIRTLNTHQRRQADRFGVEMHEMNTLDIAAIGTDFDGPVYISCDMDALDPAHAPGVSHPEPGGLTVRDLLTVIQRLPNPIAGADVVEYNPGRDINGLTAAVAAKLVKEIAAKMLLNRP